MSRGAYVVALIPARSGSKGIPRKNVAPLGGRPLIAYTIDAAAGSRMVDRIVVSTDDKEIAALARELGAEVPFLRPPELSTDGAGAAGVIAHAIRALEAADRRTIDYVVYLQPTSPLRTARHVDRALEMMVDSGADVVVSLLEVPHQFAPESLLVMDGGRVRPLEPGPSVLRRQDKPRLYARNGPAVLVLRRSQVGAADLYSGHTVGLEMGRVESLDIDSPDDLAMAEFFLDNRWG